MKIKKRITFLSVIMLLVLCGCSGDGITDTELYENPECYAHTTYADIVGYERNNGYQHRCYSETS